VGEPAEHSAPVDREVGQVDRFGWPGVSLGNGELPSHETWVQACSAAVRFHRGDQLGCEVVERLVAGEQKHVRVGDCSAGGRVAIQIDHGKVDGDGQLTAAGNRKNGESYRFLVTQARGEGWTYSVRQRIGTWPIGLAEGRWTGLAA
jgi:hypothetical protein